MKKDPRDWTGPMALNREKLLLKMGMALREHGVVFDDYDDYRGYWILKTHPERARLMALCALTSPDIPRENKSPFPRDLSGDFFTINIGGDPLRDHQFEETIDDILGLPHRPERKKKGSES